MKYKAVVSYDGSNFNGFQRQKDYRSVEGEIEKALEKLNKKPVRIIGAGRTDKEVHSYGQVFHFECDLNISEEGLKKGINAHLPEDIYIKSITLVNDEFHARYSAKSKMYRYKINVGEYNPVENKYVYQLNKTLDLEKMKKASKLFLGEHDFYNYCGYQEKRDKNFVRIINDLNIRKENDYVIIDIEGNGFIRYMVRMIVAILVEIGLNRKNEDFILQRLDSNVKNRSNYKVPGCGLYLVKIDY
jgi:tRNA pseudouridine38-40 synthase